MKEFGENLRQNKKKKDEEDNVYWLNKQTSEF